MSDVKWPEKMRHACIHPCVPNIDCIACMSVLYFNIAHDAFMKSIEAQKQIDYLGEYVGSLNLTGWYKIKFFTDGKSINDLSIKRKKDNKIRSVT